jgi:hypothetical protein
LFLGAVENLLGSRPLLGVDGRIQTIVHVAMGDLADRLGSKGECLGDSRRAEAVGKLAQRKRSQDDAYLLNSPSQQFADMREILGLDFDRNGAP